MGIARQARTHHHHLRERPRLIEQLVFGGAVLGVREEHHVGPAGVEVLHALVALAQADLDRHPRFARQRANQVDVEPLRLALVIDVFVRRELAIAAVDQGRACGCLP